MKSAAAHKGGFEGLRNANPSSESVLIGLCWAALAAGLLYRLHPLAMDGDRVARFFMTEDGYLMLTVARNLAIGNGMSVAAGEITTNGVQPLATLIFALPYLATGGDKVLSLYGVLAFSAAFSVAGAIAVHRLARLVLAGTDASPAWPLLVATLWFCGPLLLFHTMNGLETGLYTALLVATALRFASLVSRWGLFPVADRLSLGLMLGLVFLARNDGAFFVTAILLVRFVQLRASGIGFAAACAELLPIGAVSLMVAAPWLAYNHTLFGSVVPISGHSQSLGADFGHNVDIAFVKLFETMFPMLPVPAGLEGLPGLNLALGAATTVVLAIFLRRALQVPGPVRIVIAAYALYGAMIFGYYSLFFGAPHFLSRYLAPLAPLLITAATWVGLELARTAATSRWRRTMEGAGLAAVGLSAALLVRLLLPGVHEQGHFQVVDWTERNVADRAWVGAVQTGTMGYWHDRTINLDGKVNPEALRVLRERGDVLDYVVESRIDYLADWVGIAGWLDRGHARFDATFELVLADPERNLAVLRRRDGPPIAAESSH